VAKKKCVHKWVINNQNVGTCSFCGEVRQFPLEKGEEMVILTEGNPGRGPAKRKVEDVHKNILAKSRFYKQNKEAIINDLLSMGKTPARKKWGIPKGTLGRLINRWMTPEQKASIAPSPYITPVPPPTEVESGDGWLSRFPEFSMEWDPSVQVKWLEIYGKLIDIYFSEGKEAK